ncbi:MAG: outer membrane protein assembly factor [Geminicoccaceae bacterium]|nr:outer membrane protein assembly factor [Geminicoccaceae bacterium]
MTVAFVLSGLLSGCLGFGSSQDDIEDGLPPAPKGIPYQVQVEPAEGSSLEDDVTSYLLAASQAAQQTDLEPSSLFVLRRRAGNDLQRLETALRAQGYYEGSVKFRIDERDESDGAEGDGDAPEPAGDEGNEAGEASSGDDLSTLVSGPATTLVYEVSPGPRFVFGKRSLDIDGDPGSWKPPHLGKLDLKTREPAIAQKVLDAESELVRSARQNGFAFAKIADRKATVDFDTRTMDVALTLETGRPAFFAEPRFQGIDGIDESFVRGRVPFEAGEPFDSRKLERARERLIDTNLFSTVKITSGETADSDGRVPVAIEVTQRRHRTIGAGVGYLSGEGPNARLFWEHRNILGAGELFNIEAYGSPNTQQVEGRIKKPDFIMVDLSLIGEASLSSEDTDAYDSQSIGAAIGLEKVFNKHVTGSLGVAYRYATIKEDGKDEDTYGLFSIPGTLALDYSDNLLDPSEGWRLDLSSAPFWDTLGAGTTFLKSRAVHTRYFPIYNQPRLIFALRGSVGSIFGAEREEIAPDERFYAGGGGSVRGIPYQLAGDLRDGEPSGGRSVLEGSAEIRWRAFESVDLVTFTDAGSAFEEVVPTLEHNLQVGAGVGFRYITPVGPFRFDIAVPVDRRKGIDDAFQFYISIGQAF